MSNKSVNVNLLGCLPFILGCLLLGSLGFCGGTCQDMVQDGIRSTVNAFQGK
jgi:hypothetical protein